MEEEKLEKQIEKKDEKSLSKKQKKNEKNLRGSYLKWSYLWLAILIFFFITIGIFCIKLPAIECVVTQWEVSPLNQTKLVIKGKFNKHQREKIKEIKKVNVYYGWPEIPIGENKPYGYIFFELESDSLIEKKILVLTQKAWNSVSDFCSNLLGSDLEIIDVTTTSQTLIPFSETKINNVLFAKKSQITKIEKEMNKDVPCLPDFIKETIIGTFLEFILFNLFLLGNTFLKILKEIAPRVFFFWLLYWIVRRYVFSTTSKLSESFKKFIAENSRLLSGEDKEIDIPQEKVYFKDVGGLSIAKQELLEIVSLLKNRLVLENYNVKLPKGILLEGPPGNGKTLLAKALANESEMPFIFRTGSEFDEIYAGVGSLRIKRMFEKARKYSKEFGGCIIYIDEFDSLASKRGKARYENQTLNQLLSELDGFIPQDRIVVLASTNYKEILDQAVIRAGRFDRHIKINNPDSRDRREIILLQKKKFKNVNFNFKVTELVLMTSGLNAAQITTTFNEAVIMSIRKKQKVIDIDLLVEAFEKVAFGLVGSKINQNKQTTAYHESGHALVALSLPETYVNWITISSNSGGILGYTSVLLRREENYDITNLTKKEILSLIMTRLGGRVGEEIIFGEDNITSGACDDLEKISSTVKTLILRFGMTSLGIIPFQMDKEGKTIISEDLSEQAKEEIEILRRQILNDCWEKTRKIIKEKKRILKAMALSLLVKGRLSRQEVELIFITKLPSGIEGLN